MELFAEVLILENIIYFYSQRKLFRSLLAIENPLQNSRVFGYKVMLLNLQSISDLEELQKKLYKSIQRYLSVEGFETFQALKNSAHKTIIQVSKFSSSRRTTICYGYRRPWVTTGYCIYFLMLKVVRGKYSMTGRPLKPLL